MQKTRSRILSLALMVGMVMMFFGATAMAQSNRLGSWYNQPERERGTAFFEKDWEAPPKPAPVVRAPEPVATPVPVEPQPTPPPPPRVERPTEKIYFDYDKSDLRPLSREVLTKVAAYLKENPGTRLTITGHCDWIGSHAYNDPLSMRRAEEAKHYLVNTLGIEAGRVNTVGRGKREPIASNETYEGRQLNRRCEFTFTP